MYSKVMTINFDNLKGQIIEVEASIRKGMVAFFIGGKVNFSMKESKERIKSAFKNSLIKFPHGNITVNLSPANFKKQGTHFDLPIAVSILSAKGLIIPDRDTVFIGELNLEGKLMPIKNPLKFVKFAKDNNYKRIILPKGDYGYISIIKGLEILYAKDLKDVVKIIEGKKEDNYDLKYIVENQIDYEIDINDIINQHRLIRALIIAISGRHSILIKGPIGSGKSKSIKAIQSVVPELDDEQKVEMTILSNLNEDFGFVKYPRFVNINLHNKIKDLIGTKNNIGKIFFARYGFLIMDELNLYSSGMLDKIKGIVEDEEDKNLYHNITVLATMNNATRKWIQ